MPLGDLVGQPATPANLHRAAQLARAAAQHLQNEGAILTQASTQIITTSGATYTNSAIWPEWNAQITQLNNAMSNLTTTIGTTASSIGATLSVIWTAWNTQYTIQNYTTTGATTATTATFTNDWTIPANLTTTGMVNNAVWTVWADRYERINEAGDAARQIQRYSRRKLTEEELLLELEREKRLRQEAEERVLKAQQAERRAEKLLRACLSEQQIEDLEKKNCFYVEVAGRGGKKERYRIDRGSHGNVKQIDDSGSIIRSFCIQPPGVPIPDVMLTQKLYLEASDETRDEFWKTANITHLKAEKAIPHEVPRHERRRYAEAHGLLH